MILGLGRQVAAECFRELDDAVAALRPTGLPPVCLNAHAHPADLPEGAVVYNLENVPGQVGPTGFEGHDLWDFSLRNACRWERPVRFVPVGYHPSMRRFEPLPEEGRVVDVVMAGASCERRDVVLDALSLAGLRVVTIDHGVYGAERDAILARSKLALNVRFYEDGLFPVLRAAHLVANGVAVLSESAPGAPRWSVCDAPYAEVVSRALHLVRSPRNREDYAALALELFEEEPLTLP